MNSKTLDRLCNDSQKKNVPTLVVGERVITLKWTAPPRPQGSFGLVNDWVEVGDEIKGVFAKLLIPFPKNLGWVKRDTLRLFRYDKKKKRLEKVEDAFLHSKHNVVHASIERAGTYGLIGLHTHPLVQETIRQLCELRSQSRARTSRQLGESRDRICEVSLCAPDRQRFFESREAFKELARTSGVPVPDKMPAPLPRVAYDGETICDRCHGVDIVDLPDCKVLEPRAEEPEGPCEPALWENVGPKHISGAIRQIVVDPTNPRQLYAVSANGGCWRLSDVDDYPSTVWQPITDGLSNLRFRTLAVAPGDGNIIYAANSVKELRTTGSVYSEIYRSENSGQDWETIQDIGMEVVHRLVVPPGDADGVFAASSSGFWRLVDPGTRTWEALFVGDCLDFVLDPDDEKIIFLAVRNQGIFKSINSGEDWSTVPILTYDRTVQSDYDPVEDKTARRLIKIALGRRNPDQTFQTSAARTVVVRFGDEICVSQTSGEGGAAAWQRFMPFVPGANPDGIAPFIINRAPELLAGGARARSDTLPRRSNEWCFCLAVDPFDSTHFLVGSQELLQTPNSGVNWSVVDSNPHGDLQCITFDESTRGLVYTANDGGVFSSIDGGANWPQMRWSHTTRNSGRGLNLARGLIASELDHAVVRQGRCLATIDHTGFILSEDFGTDEDYSKRWQFLFATSDRIDRVGHENGYMFRCPASLDRYYVFNLREEDGLVGGLAQFDFTRTGGFVDPPDFSFLSEELKTFIPPDGDYKPEDTIWNENHFGAFAARYSEANDERLLLLGTSFRRAVGNPVGSFTIESMRLAGNGTTVTESALEASFMGQPFSAITFVPWDPDRAFAITAGGVLFERDFSTMGPFDLVSSWELPTGCKFVSSLTADFSQRLRLYALAQNAIGIFDDFSQSWTTVLWADPDESLMSLAVYAGREGTLFAGTNRGVYVSEDRGLNWISYNGNLPSVGVTGLMFDQGYLYAATFGRGLWRCKPCPK